MKKLLVILLFFITGITLSGLESRENEASERSDNTDIIPLFVYNRISLEEQKLSGLGGGIIVMSETEESEFMAALILSRHTLDKELLYDYPESFDNAEFVLQKKINRYQFFSIFQSCSDEPVTGGLNTFAFLTGCGYEIIKNKNHSLYLGASIAVSDWTEEVSESYSSPVLPLPFIHYDFTSQLLNASFDFTSSPMIDLVIGPDNPLRLNASFIIEDPESGDEGGVKIDSSLEYRFSDFAGVKAGFKAEDYEYFIGGSDDETFKLAWKALYGTLDLSLLEVTCGYIFDAQENYSSGIKRDAGEGFYLNLQLAYLF